MMCCVTCYEREEGPREWKEHSRHEDMDSCLILRNGPVVKSNLNGPTNGFMATFTWCRVIHTLLCYFVSRHLLSGLLLLRCFVIFPSLQIWFDGYWIILPIFSLFEQIVQFGFTFHTDIMHENTCKQIETYSWN